ncbi:hypothetical protein FLJC2902T_08280 [Flavobacterium limnosediminis JC2902]|uniref:Outer membrane protein n=1 Tax=Flavobacterium limnosediminis JC2902 TaxID=1341181 RepID=V6SS08_9FLAO|nr:hypothetical protein [Flavobacterium limnosediminis]ESU29426.1 hypothetical protein FLJC2902T_08280 [Flavobacterium limnosediminis JC2902]
MKTKVLLFLLLFSITVNAQHTNRVLLRGTVVSDSVDVDNIIIKNTTSNKITVTDVKGNFSLFVKERDTLVFSSISFESSILIISKLHLEDKTVKIRLAVKINALEELVVRPYALTGNLETDSKSIKAEVVSLDTRKVDFSNPLPKYNKVDNSLAQITPGSGNSFQGIDFVAVGKMAKEAIFKPKPKKEHIEYVSEKIFSDAVKEKFDPQFFTETLHVKPEEVDLFLAYCDETPSENRALLNPKKEFELIEYLLKKSEEYHKKNQ